MENKTIYMIITVFVGIVMTASLMAPVIDSVTKTETEFVNTGVYMDDDDSTARTIEWDGTTLEIDGETVTLPEDGQTPVVVCDGINAIYKNNSNFVVAIGGLNVVTSATFTAENGTLSGSIVASGTTTSKTLSYTDIELATASESDVTFSNSPYALDGASITSTGVMSFNDSGSNSHIYYWTFEGTIGGECTVTTKSDVSSQYVFSNAKINYTAVDGYVDLYKVESVSFDVAYTNPGDSSLTANFTVTCENVFAASEVTAELSDHLTASEIALMATLPLLAIVALLVFAVRSFSDRD